jgi:glycosyltransferase involved in cell wall biosynthesis
MNNNYLRLLFVIDGLGYGGKERQLAEIIKYLQNHGNFEIGVITFNKIFRHYTDYIRNSVSFFKELSKRPTRLEPILTMWKCFLEFKPDIVHTWDTISSLYSYLPTKTFRAILIDGSIRDAGIDKSWHYYFKRYFIKRADFVISNSYAGLKYYKVQGNVLYNAIDYNRFIHLYESNEFNIIKVANFTDRKDHQTFIKAAISLVKANIVENVYLVGDGPNKKKYVDLLRKDCGSIYNRFHFLGAISNVEDYIAKCKIGILCSTIEYGEGVSNSLLEYMAAGLVPISTDIGGTSEIIEDTKNGFLIKPQDSERIVELVKILRDDTLLFNNISKKAMSTIKENFSYEINMESLVKIYSDICTK